MSPSFVLWVLGLLGLLIASLVLTHTLGPAYGLGLAALYVAGRFAVAARQRRRAERSSKAEPPLTPPER